MKNKNDSNYERFPSNIFEPKILNDNNYWKERYLYLARFNSLYDLYTYLKSEPKINREIFPRLHSETNGFDFAGKPYSEALEDLVDINYETSYQEFLKLQRKIDSCMSMPVHKYKTVRTLSGGHLNIPAYSAGSPLCYETEQRIVKPKFVRIHLMLGYGFGVTKEAVFNRAVILTNILKSLENEGYMVELNSCELCEGYDEFVKIIVSLKRQGERLNMVTLHKALCHVEFLRRLLFRVLETLEVTEYRWGENYGNIPDMETIEKLLRVDESDMFFFAPNVMGITGKDLAMDFERAIDFLQLSDKIDVEKAKKEFAKGVEIAKKDELSYEYEEYTGDLIPKKKVMTKQGGFSIG